MAKAKNQPLHSCVMLVDDSDIDNFINQKMLEGSGFAGNVLVHTSGKSALELLQNYQHSSSVPGEMMPSVIFLDINMPVMDGFQFVEEYEKLEPGFRSRIKIVLLTTSVNPSDLAGAENSSHIHGFISKPLTEKHLEEL